MCRVADFCGVRRLAAVALMLVFLFSLHPQARAFLHRAKKNSDRPLLVGYFPQWGLYDTPSYRVKDLVGSGGARLLDQINYAQAFVTNGQCSVADPRADLGTAWSAEDSVSGHADDPSSGFRGYFHQLAELKRRYPRLKILISLEGKASSFAEDAQPENRRAFVASCVNTFLRGNFAPGIHEPRLFDGFDIDWEYPQRDDAANFRVLIEEFRQQMDAVRPGTRLSVAVGPAPGMLPGTDFAATASLVDEIGVMNYDYTGPWSPRTGFLAPLFPAAGTTHGGSIARSIARYEAAGVPARKLLMGLPFYGYSWTAVANVHNGLFQGGRGVHEDRPYRYIRTLKGNFSLYRDPQSHAAWLFDGTTFWTCDDPVSVRYKASYAARQRLGGIMVWELSEDTADAELLHAAHRSLLHPFPARMVAEGSTASPDSGGASPSARSNAAAASE